MNTIQLLLVEDHYFKVGDCLLDHLKQNYPDICLEITSTHEVTSDQVKQADILFGFVPKRMLKEAARLKWLQLPSSGADAYCDHTIYATADVILTNMRGVYGKPIAEHVMALILMLTRNIHRFIQENKWSKITAYRDFFNSTLGVIGLGDIGMEVSRLGKAFGAKVLGVKRTPGEKPLFVDHMYSFDQLDEVVRQSDILVLSLPQTPETIGLIDERMFDLMKPGILIINVGRGSAIVQEALVNALKDGKIAGAGLDVTTPEPLPADHPLWQMPNVVITSHTSGYSGSNWDRQFDIFKENLTRYLQGRSLMNQVNFVKKY